jgi:hypothetical protein
MSGGRGFGSRRLSGLLRRLAAGSGQVRALRADEPACKPGLSGHSPRPCVDVALQAADLREDVRHFSSLHGGLGLAADQMRTVIVVEHFVPKHRRRVQRSSATRGPCDRRYTTALRLAASRNHSALSFGVRSRVSKST